MQREAEIAAAKTLEIGDAVKVTSDQLDAAAKRMEKLQRAAERVFDATRNPMEKFVIEMEKLKELFAKGLITEEVFSRAADAAQKVLDDRIKDPAKKKRDARTSQFKQLEGGLKSIAIGGASGPRAPTAKLQEEANKKLDAVIAAVTKAGTEPVLIRWAT